MSSNSPGRAPHAPGDRDAKRLTLARVHHAAAAKDPAVGVHWRIGRTIGLIPEPAWAGNGMCWSCREPIGRIPPLCGACARLVWGDDVELETERPARRAG